MKKQLVKNSFWEFEAMDKGPDEYENLTSICIHATDFSKLRKKIRCMNKSVCFECFKSISIWYHYGVPSKKDVVLYHARFVNAHKLVFYKSTTGVEHEISI